MLPHPFPETERMVSTPFIRLSMASNFDVASISTTREALPDILKLTFICGKVCEGDSFTGSNGTSAKPTRVRQTNPSMMEKDGIFCFMFLYLVPTFISWSNIADSASFFSKSNKVSLRIL
ncbi:hypothetical protein FACS189415_5820 [Bacteroidia bacterium]|nr:hypothetical protein FACS189415_5820 [Bacteroidia bacterium]